MRWCIASGKGGTGKTTVATSLATVAAARGRSVTYVDCDVEEPNGHLYLRPRLVAPETVTRPVPEVDRDACVGCGECARICRFGAITNIGEHVLQFPDLCHSCGGCALVCPTKAISEASRPIGVVEYGSFDDAGFLHGRLRVGEPKSPPLIRAVRAAEPESGLVLVDAPPGTSCPVVESMRRSDYVVLVTEPTPFGLHDLRLTIGTVRELQLPFGVVLNRAGRNEEPTIAYCAAEGIPILGWIPDDRRIAHAYARGALACDAAEEYHHLFEDLLACIEEEAEKP